MGELPRRQSIPLRSVVQIPSGLGLLLRDEFQRIVSPGAYVEFEHPERTPGQSPCVRELPGQSGRSYVGWQLQQPGSLLPRKCGKRNLHLSGIHDPGGQWSVLNGGEYRATPPLDSSESKRGAIVRELVLER